MYAYTYVKNEYDIYTSSSSTAGERGDGNRGHARVRGAGGAPRTPTPKSHTWNPKPSQSVAVLTCRVAGRRQVAREQGMRRALWLS